MNIYYVHLDVVYKKVVYRHPLMIVKPKRVILGKKKEVSGYLQEVGATFQDIDELKEQLRLMVIKKEMGTKFDLHFDYIGVISPDDIEKEIYEDEEIKDSLLGNPYERGVWYKTGRGFYQED